MHPPARRLVHCLGIQQEFRIAEAIQALYDDQPIIGDPDMLDLGRRERRGAHA